MLSTKPACTDDLLTVLSYLISVFFSILSTQTVSGGSVPDFYTLDTLRLETDVSPLDGGVEKEKREPKQRVQGL